MATRQHPYVYGTQFLHKLIAFVSHKVFMRSSYIFVSFYKMQCK